MIESVIKRTGDIVEYNREKIVNAIKSAELETSEEIENINKVLNEVESIIENKFDEDNLPNVEDIQDIVENILMDVGYHKVAKRYIIYREIKAKKREEEDEGILSREFLSKYKHKPNPFPTELGEFIYYRTYSRWLPEEQRREYWWETVKRAVEYNASIAPTTEEEAEKLFDNVYNFRQFLAGRTLWTGGTEASKKYPMSNYNCAFTVIDNYKSYEDLFYLLLIGAGVGVRVQEKDVEKLAPIRTDVKVKHEYYKPKPKKERAEFTSYNFDDNDTTMRISVGDSKEAWVQSLKILFEALTRHEYRRINKIYFNYDSVRPKGERLKTFGGHASGHESIKKMFDKIDNLLNKKEKDKVSLKPIDCLDIANIIGENVVSGGVRRTSEVGLFDADDEDIKTAKNNLYIQQDGEWQINKEIEHRQMSNNSIFYEEKPSREQLHWHVEQMRYSGEPGFANAEVGRERRDNFKGANPCMEILLDSNGMCNLVSLNVMSFVDEDGNLDKEAMFEAQTLNARASYRMALVDFELPEWDYVNKRDRLIGLSITGWQDMVNAVGLNKQEEKELLTELREVANDSAKEVAHEYDDNEPVLVTTVKPEGTQTQMPTVSSGLHYSHSPYYFRRVRISVNDPLVKVADDLNWNVYNEVGQSGDDLTTKVLEFPIKAPKGRVKKDAGAIEQLETYKMFMENYVDHNASITVHVRDDEWEDVEQWLWDNWEYVFGVSFLSYNDSFYQLMPYEECSEEEYEELLDKMEEFKPHLVNKYEKEVKGEREINDDNCEVCPIR